MADSNVVAALFEGAELHKTLDLATDRSIWTVMEYRLPYGLILNAHQISECFSMAEGRRWLIVAARGMTRILASRSNVELILNDPVLCGYFLTR